MKVLRDMRKELNLTRAEMATELGVSLSLYDKVERGERAVSRKLIEKLLVLNPNLDTNIFFK